MSRHTPHLAILAMGLAVVLSSCGVRDAPEAPGGAGGTDGHSGGAGAAGGAGSCGVPEKSYFAACWGPADRDAEGGAPAEDPFLRSSVPGLRVVQSVEPDVYRCITGFPPMSWHGGYETAPFSAWELEDVDGVRWFLQFAVDGVTADVLSVGDVVEFVHLGGFLGFGEGPHGYVALEKSGSPAVGIALNELPQLSGVADLAIARAQALCSEQEDEHCHVARTMRVTANGESKLLSQGESADFGELRVVDGYYVEYRECEGQHSLFSEEFLLGFRSVSGAP